MRPYFMTPTDSGISITPSIHGPYEDLAIQGLKVLQVLIQSQPPDVQQKLWNDFLVFITGLQTFASKIDVFHLFTSKS